MLLQILGFPVHPGAGARAGAAPLHGAGRLAVQLPVGGAGHGRHGRPPAGHRGDAGQRGAAAQRGGPPRPRRLPLQVHHDLVRVVPIILQHVSV